MFSSKLEYSIVLAIAIIIVAPNTVFGQTAEDELPTLIMAGKMWDGLANRSLGQTEILVDNGTIIEIGENVSKPDNYRQVDLSNYTVTPGLMDLHTHLSINPDPVLVENTIQDYILTSNYAKLLTAVSHANRLLMSGFTTTRDTGEPFPGTAMVDVRDAIERGEITGSRLVIAPHVAATKGSHGDLAPAAPTDLEEGLKVEGARIGGDVDVREFVRNEVSRGADWIKIIGNGAFFEPLHPEDVQSWTDEEIQAMIEEGIKWGKPVAIHAHIPHTIQLAVNSGVSSVEHGSLVDNETIELMEEKGTAFMPTLNNFDFLVPTVNQTWLSLQPDYIVERVQKNATNAQEARQLIVNSTDLKIGYGSDAGYAIPIEDNWKEFYSMIESGFTPIRALKTATSVAADIIDRPDL
jgi:imidazolonepropionase-like amidohydrolase